MTTRFFKKPATKSASILPKKTIKKPESYTITDEYRHTVLANSYLGKKGYTISKTALTKEEEDFLKKDLFMRPVVHGVSYGVPETAFPVYRENTNKIYIPRFYGVSRYGLPTKSEIDLGTDIAVTFDKPLRDYQEKIIKIYTDYVNTPISLENEDVYGGGAILEVPCGRGKCLAKDTPILMFDGTIKPVQDVVVGDLLMGDDSTARKVLSLARGKEMMYKISSTQNKEMEEYVVNKSHILSLKHQTTAETVDISIMDYLRYIQKRKEMNMPSEYHGFRVPVTFPHKETEIDPYLVGSWLFSAKPSFYIPPSFLQKYKLSEIRHIPHHYKCNSRDVQLRVFAGMIDTIHPPYENMHYEFTVDTPQLYVDVVFLARSLGFLVEKHPNN